MTSLLLVVGSESRALRMRRQTNELVCNLCREASFPPGSLCDGLQSTCATESAESSEESAESSEESAESSEESAESSEESAESSEESVQSENSSSSE